MERAVSTRLKDKPNRIANIPHPYATTKAPLRDFRFAMAYLKEPNATKAAIAIGMAPRSASAEGHKLLKKPEVQAHIAKARAMLEERTTVTVEKLLRELGKVAFASMQDYYTIGSDGQPILDMSQLTPEQWAAIGEITTEEYMDGPAGRERPVKRVRFKLHDKLAAIDKAMRHLGGYSKDSGGSDAVVERTENTVTYTLNIGTANIQVNAGKEPPAPKLIEG